MTVKVHKRARPRVQPNWYGEIVSDRSFELSRELSQELCEIAELDEHSRKAKNMLFSVAEELSMFKSAQAALDHSPRPAHKRQLLESVLKPAKENPTDSWIEAAEALTFSGPLAWEFQHENWPATADQEFFESEWPRVAEVVLEKLCAKESRRGFTQKAKYRLRNELAFIFDAYAESEHQNGLQILRADFVDTALTAMGFPKSDPKKLEHGSSTSRLVRELPEQFTLKMVSRRARLHKTITRAAETKGQSVEVFLSENPNFYEQYREAAPKVKKS